MASDSTGLYIFGFILLLIIVFFAYGYLNPRLTADKRKQLIKAFKASAVIAKDGPALVQGTVTAPDVILPSTGEHVAYYGMFVLSKETSISETRKGIDIRVSGIPIDPNRTKIDSVQGFTFFETSGDFTVASGGTYYVVRPSTVFSYFKKGMDMVAGLVAGQAAAAGMPERVVRDNMDFTLAQTALKMFCGFEAPLVEDRSRSRSGSWSSTTTTQRTAFSVVTAKGWIDSRVHHFMAGYNLPEGLLNLLEKRGIALKEKDEVIVVETFIPLNREVFVFGTFDGDKSIVYTDSTVQLSVSFKDPEGE